MKRLFTRKYFIKVTLPIILLIILAIIAWFTWQKPQATKILSPAEAKTQTENFINKYLMRGSNKATIKSISDTKYGLYKLKVDIVSSIVDSYLSKDGKLFFPQALDVNNINKGKTNNTQTNESAPSSKVNNRSDKPVVKLFVMSYCPYGTQIEKGILPVLSTLNKKIDFQLKFVDYAMHGTKELNENLTQVCIRKNQPEKLTSYLACFLKAGNSDSCLKANKINKNEIKSCVNKIDKQFKITSNADKKIAYRGSYPSFNVDEAENIQYKVAGSPTLIINDQQISSNRDSASLLKTICSAFKNKPKECETSLSSSSPSPGFGFSTPTNTDTPAAACGQ